LEFLISTCDRRSPTVQSTHEQTTKSKNTKAAPATSANLVLDINAFGAESMDRIPHELVTNIQAHLDVAACKDFASTVEAITRSGYGHSSPSLSHHKKLRDLVTRNKHIAALYNAYATVQAASEARVTHRLPIFIEVEGPEQAQLSYVRTGDKGPEYIAICVAKAQEQAMIQVRQEQHKDAEAIHEPKTDGITSVFDNRGIDYERVQVAEQTSVEDQESMTSAEAAKQRWQVHPTSEVAMTDMPHITTETGQTKSKTSGSNNIISQQVDPRTVRELWSQPPTNNHLFIMPITNPEKFPVHRLQTVQAQYYPSAKVINMLAHRDINGDIVQVTADLQDGPVNHILINDYRIISALGLREGTHDTIILHEDQFRQDETFIINVSSRKELQNLESFIVGELQSARHTYLHWLDFRSAANPNRGPYIHEARMIAVQLGRRASDVWREIEGYWQLEQGSEGRRYREGRIRYLGEDPNFAEGIARTTENATSMWT
jgi:hypothetical protein